MINIQNLTKRYKTAEKDSLTDVSLHIKEGEFVALLGPNGAGKTTLINTLIGNVEKTSGTIKIGGHNLDTDPLKTKRILGVVPQEIAVDRFFTVAEMLRNYSGYFGIRNNEEYIDELLEALSLTEKKHAKTSALSGGMKRRLIIAKALVHKPKVFLLDEPTAGVDIELRQQLYTFLRKLHSEGMTIVLTTHYLEEAELLCDRVVIINHGKMVVDQSKEELLNSLDGAIHLEFLFDEEIQKKDFEFLGKQVTEVYKNRLCIAIKKSEMAELFQKLESAKISYRSFRIKEEKLEDVFLRLVSE